VAIVWENVDMKKFEAALADPAIDKARAKHTVREPSEFYVEGERGR
jgi:hypothetical protein